MQARMLGGNRGVALERTSSDPTQLSDSTKRGGRSRLVVRRPWQDERLPGSHIGTGLSLDRGEQRRENVRGEGRAISRRRRYGSLGRCGTRVEDRPPRLQRLTSLEPRPTDGLRSRGRGATPTRDDGPTAVWAI